MTDEERLASVPDYRRLRARLVALQNLVSDGLRRDVLDEAASRLGLMRGGVLSLSSELELGVVADFAIYDIRRHWQTRVERFVADRFAKLDPEGRAVLAAMAEQRYALLRVTRTLPGAGVHVDDLLGGSTTFLYDIGLSQSAEPGLIIATRVVAPEGVTMTTGAGLPIVVLPDEAMEEFNAGLRQSGLSRLAEQGPSRRTELAQAIIEVALEGATKVAMFSHDATDPAAPVVPITPPAVEEQFGPGPGGRSPAAGRGSRSVPGRPSARP